jgi:hypothetical protein
MSARKRTSLEAVFAEADLPQASASRGKSRVPEDEAPRANSELQDGKNASRFGESKRPNVKQHTAYLALAVHEQLRKLAFEENSKIHDYLIEGLDRVFADRGLPSVSDLSVHADTRSRE